MINLIALIVCQPAPAITTPPKELAQGFYTKMVMFEGMPVLASPKVESAALLRIKATFEKMLSRAPAGTMKALVEAGCHYSIIAEEEGQTDLPEYHHLKNDPNTDWNKRARGLGGKYTSGGEENILELASDRYRGESIYIHEFAHTLDQFGFSKIDRNFKKELSEAYRLAKEEGLWKDTYAITNAAEYWAEGVQSYFDCNRVSDPPNGIHNAIGNRSRLKSYDPRLFKLIDRSFGSNPWRYEGKYNTSKVPDLPHRN